MGLRESNLKSNRTNQLEVGEEVTVGAIAGVFGAPNATGVVKELLDTLLSRAKQSGGISVKDPRNGNIRTVKARLNLGRGQNLTLNHLFPPELLEKLEGRRMAIGHLRALGIPRDRQSDLYMGPHYHGTMSRDVVTAFSGKILNASRHISFLTRKGVVFPDQELIEDGHVFVAMVSYIFNQEMNKALTKKRYNRERIGALMERKFEIAVKMAMKRIRGAYAALVISEFADSSYALRSSIGVQELHYGRLDGAFIFASESGSIRMLEYRNAEYMGSLGRGTLVKISPDGLSKAVKIQKPEKSKCRGCAFNPIYTGHPCSGPIGKQYMQYRVAMGEELFHQHPIEGDLVCYGPDSGHAYAIGYANASGIPLMPAMIKNLLVTASGGDGRSFLHPDQESRKKAIRRKVVLIKGFVKGKRVIVIEDSLVRGTVLELICELLWAAGAAEVHVLLASPPYIRPCPWGGVVEGIEELKAPGRTIEEIRQAIMPSKVGGEGGEREIDASNSSVNYISFARLKKVLRRFGISIEDWCYVCIDPNFWNPYRPRRAQKIKIEAQKEARRVAA